MLVVLAVLSMAIGNIVAIAQSNLKRMLAYSTISHVGYILLGFLSGTAQGYRRDDVLHDQLRHRRGGAFGMILLLARQGFEADKLVDFKGLQPDPWFAGMMVVLMFSRPACRRSSDSGPSWASSRRSGRRTTWPRRGGGAVPVVGAFFYLRIVKLMYFDEPVGRGRTRRASRACGSRSA